MAGNIQFQPAGYYTGIIGTHPNLYEAIVSKLNPLGGEDNLQVMKHILNKYQDITEPEYDNRYLNFYRLWATGTQHGTYQWCDTYFPLVERMPFQLWGLNLIDCPVEENGTDTNKYNLMLYNSDYFEDLETLCREANASYSEQHHKIVICITLFESNTMEGTSYVACDPSGQTSGGYGGYVFTPWHPHNNNNFLSPPLPTGEDCNQFVNPGSGINKQMNFVKIFGESNKNLYDVQKSYVQKIVAHTKEFGNVYYELFNELDVGFNDAHRIEVEKWCAEVTSWIHEIDPTKYIQLNVNHVRDDTKLKGEGEPEANPIFLELLTNACNMRTPWSTDIGDAVDIVAYHGVDWMTYQGNCLTPWYFDPVDPENDFDPIAVWHFYKKYFYEQALIHDDDGNLSSCSRDDDANVNSWAQKIMGTLSGNFTLNGTTYDIPKTGYSHMDNCESDPDGNWQAYCTCCGGTATGTIDEGRDLSAINKIWGPLKDYNYDGSPKVAQYYDGAIVEEYASNEGNVDPIKHRVKITVLGTMTWNYNTSNKFKIMDMMDPEWEGEPVPAGTYVADESGTTTIYHTYTDFTSKDRVLRLARKVGGNWRFFGKVDFPVRFQDTSISYLNGGAITISRACGFAVPNPDSANYTEIYYQLVLTNDQLPDIESTAYQFTGDWNPIHDAIEDNVEEPLDVKEIEMKNLLFQIPQVQLNQCGLYDIKLQFKTTVNGDWITISEKPNAALIHHDNIGYITYQKGLTKRKNPESTVFWLVSIDTEAEEIVHHKPVRPFSVPDLGDDKLVSIASGDMAHAGPLFADTILLTQEQLFNDGGTIRIRTSVRRMSGSGQSLQDYDSREIIPQPSDSVHVAQSLEADVYSFNLTFPQSNEACGPFGEMGFIALRDMTTTSWGQRWCCGSSGFGTTRPSDIVWSDGNPWTYIVSDYSQRKLYATNGWEQISLTGGPVNGGPALLDVSKDDFKKFTYAVIPSVDETENSRFYVIDNDLVHDGIPGNEIVQTITVPSMVKSIDAFEFEDQVSNSYRWVILTTGQDAVQGDSISHLSIIRYNFQSQNHSYLLPSDETTEYYNKPIQSGNAVDCDMLIGDGNLGLKLYVIVQDDNNSIVTLYNLPDAIHYKDLPLLANPEIITLLPYNSTQQMRTFLGSLGDVLRDSESSAFSFSSDRSLLQSQVSYIADLIDEQRYNEAISELGDLSFCFNFSIAEDRMIGGMQHLCDRTRHLLEMNESSNTSFSEGL